MLSKEVSSTIFKVFGMKRPEIEPRSPGPLANICCLKDLLIITIAMHHKEYKENDRNVGSA